MHLKPRARMAAVTGKQGSDRPGMGALPPPALLARLPAAERPAALASRHSGLTEQEVARRATQFGRNEPLTAVRGRIIERLVTNFTHMLALLLWFAAGLAFAAGINELGGAIVAVVCINGAFAFLQEYRAERVIQGLMERVALQAWVRRDGRELRVPAASLAPGDIVRLSAGDIVPADGALLEAEGLTVDLSLITGESAPVERTPAAVEADDRATITELACMVPAGAALISGSGMAVVTATGPASTIGQIAALVEGVGRGQSYLERQVAELSRLTAVIAVLAGTATLMLAALTGRAGFLSGLTFATGVIVALAPEGLLPTLSVSLAIGARRMAERGAAVRRLSAVEVIGSVTVICTDKTGTLTENALTVLGVTGPDGEPAAPQEALRAAILCNDARQTPDGLDGDPLDRALLAWATTMSPGLASLPATAPRLHAEPFDARKRYMTVTCDVEGVPSTYLKGAPEAVAERCGGLPPPLVAAVEAAARAGERVILLAGGPAASLPRPLGLVRLHDPPRPDVAEAVAACHRAGIRIAMLTGDHPATARNIAIQIGLGSAAIPVVDGHQVDSMADGELVRLLQQDVICARVDPRQKLRLVTALRRAGEIVVVTGDGINDAPALRAADVGVAMGRRGTEVAKQAADIVLADDHFATIVAAIEEGRSIRANIRRFVSYVFTSNVAEVAPFLLFLFLPAPLALTVIQALAVDLGTDLLPALALGAEPAAAHVMDRPPEPPHTPILGRALGLRTFLFFGLIEATLGLAGFSAYEISEGWRPFDSFAAFAAVERQATVATFLAIVGGQVGCLFAQRDGSLWQRLSPRANRWIAAGLAFEVGLAVALVYLPGLNRVFGMAAVSPLWLLLTPLAAVLFLALDLMRRALSRPSRR